ncbi:hypothetical protein [Rhodophyticola sp. CCM32]|uniref:hypothetical protein n=1 Tax=Rhodophyticola sp. CCM32 TaxID=2916397 RepID=UPI00143CCE16|nr:hypothetical protein [Rhodophyticola sp. CCM32]
MATNFHSQCIENKGKPSSCAKNVIFLQKTSCGSPSQTVDTPSPAALRRLTGAPNGPQGNETQTKIEIMQAGRAKQVTAHLSLFCLMLFEIDGI